MEKQIAELKTKLEVLNRDIKYIREVLAEIKVKLKDTNKKHVSLSRFKPVELLAYGLASGILMWTLNQVLQVTQALS